MDKAPSAASAANAIDTQRKVAFFSDVTVVTAAKPIRMSPRDTPRAQIVEAVIHAEAFPAVLPTQLGLFRQWRRKSGC
jgi:hypothetical protein